MSLEIGILIVLEYFSTSLVGILFGPIDYLRFNVLIMSSTSPVEVVLQVMLELRIKFSLMDLKDNLCSF